MSSGPLQKTMNANVEMTSPSPAVLLEHALLLFSCSSVYTHHTHIGTPSHLYQQLCFESFSVCVCRSYFVFFPTPYKVFQEGWTPGFMSTKLYDSLASSQHQCFSSQKGLFPHTHTHTHGGDGHVHASDPQAFPRLSLRKSGLLLTRRVSRGVFSVTSLDRVMYS